MGRTFLSVTEKGVNQALSQSYKMMRVPDTECEQMMADIHKETRRDFPETWPPVF